MRLKPVWYKLCSYSNRDLKDPSRMLRGSYCWSLGEIMFSNIGWLVNYPEGKFACPSNAAWREIAETGYVFSFRDISVCGRSDSSVLAWQKSKMHLIMRNLFSQAAYNKYITAITDNFKLA